MSDFQNAFETGKMVNYRKQAAYSAEINAVLNAGRFALVAVMPAYCPFTDATTGAAHHLVSAHETREDANQAAAQHYEDFPAEIDYVVFPKLPRAAFVASTEDSDIPF